MNMKRNNPIAHNPIPKEASLCYAIRSESRPAKGDNNAIIKGWLIRIKPAACESNPRITCRYIDSK